MPQGILVLGFLCGVLLLEKRLSNLNVEGRHSGQSPQELVWIMTGTEQPYGKKFTEMKKAPHPCEKWACGGQESGRARGAGCGRNGKGHRGILFALSSPFSFSCNRGNVWNFMSVVKSNFPFVVNSVLADFGDWLRNVLLLQSHFRFVGSRSPSL